MHKSALFSLWAPFAFLVSLFGILFFATQKSPSVQPKTQTPENLELILPILERRCSSSCHGIPSSQFEQRTRHEPYSHAFYFALDEETGEILRTKEALKDLRERLFSRVLPDLPEESDLLLYPLDQRLGGKAHQIAQVFVNRRDQDFQTLLHWVKSLSLQPEPVEPPSRAGLFFEEQVLPILVRKGCFLSSCHGPNTFNDFKLTPPTPSRHTFAESNSSKGFLQENVAKNRRAAKGEILDFIARNAELEQSRLLQKALPLHDGGIPHKGGNLQFFHSSEEPDAKTIKTWMQLEKEEELQELKTQISLHKKGLIYLRKPRQEISHPLGIPDFIPKSRLIYAPLDPETLENTIPEDLTHFLGFSNPVQIHSLAISFDASRLVLSLRDGPYGFSLYEMKLDPQGRPTQSLRPLLISTRPDLHYVDPLFVPKQHDPEPKNLSKDDLVFASNLLGRKTYLDPKSLNAKAEILTENQLRIPYLRQANQEFSGLWLHFIQNGQRIGKARIQKHSSDPQGASILELQTPRPQKWKSPYQLFIELPKPRLASAMDLFFLSAEHPHPVQLTHSGGTDRYPTLRGNGEILFTSLRNYGSQGGFPIYNAAIYRVQPEGFDYHVHGGNRSRIPIYQHSREFPNGFEARIGLFADNLFQAGALYLVEHSFGVNLEAGNPFDSVEVTIPPDQASNSLQRFLHSVFPLSAESGPNALSAGGVSQKGAYRDPLPLENGNLLVSFAKGPVTLNQKEVFPDFDLNLIQLESSICSPNCTEAKVKAQINLKHLNTPNFNEVSPVIVQARFKPRPKAHHKHSVHAHKITSTTPFGEIQCYDYPLLQSFLTNSAPEGRKLQPSEARYVRVLLLKHTQDGTPYLATAEEIPIQPDGSFAALLPKETPFLLQGLNSQKQAIHQMSRFAWVKPGEKLTFSIPRSLFSLRCAGCHGPLSGQKEDTFSPPDLVTRASEVLANWDALKHTPRRPPKISEKTVLPTDFQTTIVPILASRCVSCHGIQGTQPYLGRGQEGNYQKTYETLLESANFIDAPLSIQSPLIRILDEHTKKYPDFSLNAEERLEWIRFIDTGSSFQSEGKP